MFLLLFPKLKVEPSPTVTKMPRGSTLPNWLFILKKINKAQFSYLVSLSRVPSQSHSLFDSSRKQIFGFGMGVLFNPGFHNLGKIREKDMSSGQHKNVLFA